MVMYPRCGLVRAVNSVSKHSSVSRSSSPGHALASLLRICTSICGRFRYDADPHTSETYGARSKIFSPSCCATQPSTPNFLPCFLHLLVIGEAIENFLLGLVADRAGVVENQIGLFDRLDLPIAFLHERPHDLFGVVDVHLAAESFEVERLLRIAWWSLLWNPRHIGKYNAGAAATSSNQGHPKRLIQRVEHKHG